MIGGGSGSWGAVSVRGGGWLMVEQYCFVFVGARGSGWLGGGVSWQVEVVG